jgi:hypothetical protein
LASVIAIARRDAALNKVSLNFITFSNAWERPCGRGLLKRMFGEVRRLLEQCGEKKGNKLTKSPRSTSLAAHAMCRLAL